jgi:hypothetical protein
MGALSPSAGRHGILRAKSPRMKTGKQDAQEDKLATSTRAERSTVASEDQGAEVARAADRPSVADDYEASARLGTKDRQPAEDFSDEEFAFDRPDTAAIAAEEGGDEDEP